MSTPVTNPIRLPEPAAEQRPQPFVNRPVFDADQGEFRDYAIYRRPDLLPGDRIAGPAIIVEDETSTLVPPAFEVRMNRLGYLILERLGKEGDVA